MTQECHIPIGNLTLTGNLNIPDKPKGIIIFSHGSGSSRLSPRNLFVAETLQTEGFATLLFDLLTPKEDQLRDNRFDIQLLTQRLVAATRWIGNQPKTKMLKIGYFGASTGAASALNAAATLGVEVIKAIVSRGGRPDLAGDRLKEVKSPTLLLVGERDTEVIKLNERAFKWLSCRKKLTIVSGATHLFEEQGALEHVTRHASDWFLSHLCTVQPEIEKDFME